MALFREKWNKFVNTTKLPDKCQGEGKGKTSYLNDLDTLARNMDLHEEGNPTQQARLLNFSVLTDKRIQTDVNKLHRSRIEQHLKREKNTYMHRALSKILNLIFLLREIVLV